MSIKSDLKNFFLLYFCLVVIVILLIGIFIFFTVVVPIITNPMPSDNEIRTNFHRNRKNFIAIANMMKTDKIKSLGTSEDDKKILSEQRLVTYKKLLEECDVVGVYCDVSQRIRFRMYNDKPTFPINSVKKELVKSSIGPPANFMKVKDTDQHASENFSNTRYLYSVIENDWFLLHYKN